MKLIIFINFLFLLAVAEDSAKKTMASTINSTQGLPMRHPESEVDSLKDEEHSISCTANNLFENRQKIPQSNKNENERDDMDRYIARAYDDFHRSEVYTDLLNFEVRIKNLNLTLVYTPGSFLEELEQLESDMFLRCVEFGTEVTEVTKEFQQSYAAMYMSVSHLLDKHLPRGKDTCPEHIQNRLECLKQFGKTEKEMMKWLQEDNNSENNNLITVPRPLAKGTKGISKASKQIYVNTQKSLTNRWMIRKNHSLQLFFYNPKFVGISEYKRSINRRRNQLFGEQNSYSLSALKESLIFEPELILAVMEPYIHLYMNISYYVENDFHTMDPIGVGDLNHTLAQRCNFLESFQTASKETMIWALEQREEAIEDYYTFDIYEKREQDKKVIQDHLFNPMDVFLRNSSGSNFCRELTPLGIFTDDKSDFTFDIYGRKCIKPCTDYGRYWYCYYSDTDWHYCSPKGQTKKGETCKSQCTQGQNTSYYWCKTNNSWNTCSPHL